MCVCVCVCIYQSLTEGLQHIVNMISPYQDTEILYTWTCGLTTFPIRMTSFEIN